MKRIFCAGILLFSLFLLAATPATDSWIDSKVRTIADQLRCPVCRGVPIAESPSEMARDMMQLVRQQLTEGKNEQEILSFFEDRYGEWILLRPKARGLHLSLWVLPAVLLIGGVVLIGLAVVRWTQKSNKEVL